VLRHSPEEHFEELKEIIQLNFELRYNTLAKIPYKI